MKNLRLWFYPCLAAILSLVALCPSVHAQADTMAESVAAEKTHLHYLAAGQPDVVALLAPPPLPGSPEQAADMQTVQEVYHACGSNDMAVAYSQKKFDIFNFTPAIGDFFQRGKFPQTEAFFHKVQSDAETVTDQAKDHYKRPRPYFTDPTLANGKLETSYSYPSGHSTESMVLALVLADLFPDQHDAIIGTARTIGWHRVMIARHYPTDIYAGRVLAQAIVEQMKKSGDFQEDFAAAKAELAHAKSATIKTLSLTPR
ncbi:MAG TPA: phosphatase PAP2 family protein [Verrucomicrobiae bacterium]|jgi:acid phosphatase (class A)